jgi:formiminotetrahydrofolate cyclodeaminase
MPRLIDLDLGSFGQRLADKSATPGGGSVAAHLVQLGAGLIAMACRFSTGPKFPAVEEAMLRRAAELDRLRAQSLELVDRDSTAYDLVTAAFGLPKNSDAEKAARSATVQRATRTALEVPLETIEVAVGTLHLALDAAPAINKNLASDCASGAWCLRAAAEAALLNVRINAGSLNDKAYAQERLARAENLVSEARALAESVRGVAEGLLG